MVQKTITLNIPEHLYERVQQIAEHSGASPEQVLLDGALFLLQQPPLTIDPESLKAYTDIQLWTTVFIRLSPTQEHRLAELREEASKVNLPTTSQNEREHLLEIIDQQMLLRSHALVLLKQRGYEIDHFFKPKTK